MRVYTDDWVAYEYQDYMDAMLENWQAEQERAYEEWLFAQPEDATRYPEEEDYTEDDFPR